MPLTPDDITFVLEHMNADHREASLAIARAHGYPAADSAEMTGVDEHGGTWQISEGTAEAQLRVVWPEGPVEDQHGVRDQVVALTRAAPRG